MNRLEKRQLRPHWLQRRRKLVGGIVGGFDFPDAPNTGGPWGRYEGAWVEVVEEAPKDGTLYGRKDDSWQPIVATGAASGITFAPVGNISATNVQAAIAELDAEKVAKAGDTMTGNLRMPVGSAATPSINFGTVNTGFYGATTTLLASTNGVNRLTLSDTVLTLTVPVMLPAAPTADLHASTKKYVDDKIALAGSYTDEQAMDACAALIKNGPGVTWAFDDAANTLTPTVTGAPASGVTFPPSGNISAGNIQDAIIELDNEKVAKAGDTMTGNLTVTKSGPVIYLNRATADSTLMALVGRENSLNHWVLYPGGGGAADDFMIARHDDTGTIYAGGYPLRIIRATGQVQLQTALASTSKTTGGVTISGGLGISGDIFGNGITLTAPLVMPATGTAAATSINFGTAGTGLYGTSTVVYTSTAGVVRHYTSSAEMYSNVNIRIDKSAPMVTLVKALAAESCSISGQLTSGLNRWNLSVADATTETGSGNNGSNFSIYRYADAGTYLDRPFMIERYNGQVLLTYPIRLAAGAVADVALKFSATAGTGFYGSATTISAAISGVNKLTLDAATLVAAVNITLPNDPIIPLGAATKQYVDSAIVAASNVVPSNSVPVMNGTGAPGVGLPYSRDDHVHPSDLTRYAVAGGVVTGTVTIGPAAGASVLSLNPTAGSQQARIDFRQTSVTTWQLGKQTDGSFFLYDAISASTVWSTGSSGTYVSFYRPIGFTSTGTATAASLYFTNTPGTGFYGSATAIYATAGGVERLSIATTGINSSVNLTVTKSTPVISLQKPDNTTVTSIYAYVASLFHWHMQLGGGGSANNFLLQRYDDAGASLGYLLTGNRLTGVVGINSTVATTTTTSGALVVTGGIGVGGGITAGGAVMLAGAPTVALQAATKQYVDDTVSGVGGVTPAYVDAADALRVLKSGDTMTGNLTVLKSQPGIFLNRPSGAEASAPYVSSGMNNVGRWTIFLGAGGASDDFYVRRHDDAGVSLSEPLRIGRLTGVTSFPFNLASTSSSTGAIVVTGGVGIGGMLNVGASGIKSTGIIEIEAVTPQIILDKSSTATNVAQILATVLGVNRWALRVNNGSAESSGNLGSDFSIIRYDDAGATIDTPFIISRATGRITIKTNPTLALELAPKQYVDLRVDKAGDTMTGDLKISKTEPLLILEKTTGNATPKIFGRLNGLNRWCIELGNSTAEGGSNLGSNFAIARFDDSGVEMDKAISIARNTGEVFVTCTVSSSTPLTGALRVQGGLGVSGNINAAGAISCRSANPSLAMYKAVNQTAQIQSWAATSQRWTIEMADGAVESGGNAGSNFGIHRYADNGTWLNQPITINRATGNVWLTSIVASTSTSTGTLTISGGLGVAQEMWCQVVNVQTSGANPAPPVGAGLRVAFTGGGAQWGAAFRPFIDDTCAIGFHSSQATFVGQIYITATATAYYTSSDRRLKDDLQSFDAGEIIDALHVYDFRWKVDGKRSHGVVAQEAFEAYPDASIHDEKTDTWMTDYSKYVPLLLQEMKSLRSRIAQLELH